jgi:integrase
MDSESPAPAGLPGARPAIENESALLAIQSDERGERGERGDPSDPNDTERAQTTGRPWRVELTRWLLTLNPGRTQDEYAKAVSYFFETPGVSQDLELVSPDLLLAYRGALAMRAQRGRDSRPTRADAAGARLARLLGTPTRAEAFPGDAASKTPPTGRRPTSLAPATVNLRLTALRQFLRYATLRDQLPGLAPERIQLALRRLPIERRRPYQILSEDEWPAFLETARRPMARASSKPPAANEPSSHASIGVASTGVSPWGRTRAERLRAKSVATTREEAEDTNAAHQAPLHASDGRTGALTAQRDFALAALALATGLRAIEMSLLDVGDLTRERRRGRDEWWLTLPDAKTKGQRGGRTLPLAPDLVAVLIEYLSASGRMLAAQQDRESPLFLALPRGPRSGVRDQSENRRQRNERRRLRPEQIRGVINRIETQWAARVDEEAGAPEHAGEARRISPHALRHSAAIALLKGSDETGRPPASVEHVRGWLGHFDIRTTQRYLDHLSSREERRRFAIAPTPPLASQPRQEMEGSATEGSAKPEAGKLEPGE